MLLAVRLGAPRFVITTSVDFVYENFYSEEPVPRPQLTADEVQLLADSGQFAEGSMAPKMEAAVDYLAALDGQVVICSPDDLVDAVEGRAGTHIHRS